MAVVFDILKKERKRLLELSAQYEREIAQLPKGSISRKRRWNREYCYLAYREAGKVKFDYVGAVESEAAGNVAAKIERRKQLADKRREVRDNLRQVERGLRGQN